jgi:hypothetical protein
MHREIKRFVQTTLGCSCPDEVFKKIDFQRDCDEIQGTRIIIGDRLLIYIISTEGKSGFQEDIKLSLEQGIEERDKKGLNRFRLVLVVSCPDELRSSAEHAFYGAGYSDEKTHIHVVNEYAVQGF